MKSQDKLRKFSEVIAGIVSNAYHYERANKDFPCAVWQEDGMDLMKANDRCAEISVYGSIDYFTKEEFDPAIDNLFDGLTSEGICWSVESTQYEEETGLIHYEVSWRF